MFLLQSLNVKYGVSLIISGGFGCPDDKFTCKNLKCISHALKCDNNDDCGDNSDEEEGCCEFRCRNQKCILRDELCNGIDDCGDFSDEEDCKGNLRKFNS